MEMRKPLQLTCLLLYASANLFATVKTEKFGAIPALRPVSSGLNKPYFLETIKGTVKDNKGGTLPGVSVKVKSSGQTTQTNASGQYSINAKAGDVLVFSYVGYQSKEVTVSSQGTIDVVLAEDAQNLEGVVVTALGIKKSTKSLTYNVQTLSSKEVNEVKDPSFVNSLTGKVSGLTLTHSSAPGGSTKAVLRGNKSISGNNNALYVVDGVPLPSLSGAGTTDGFQISDGGDGISNLNPEDIEEVSVLSGASASALYGGQASNGVILITTKKGKAGKTAVNFNSSTTFDNPFILPKTQNTYGTPAPATAGGTPAYNGWGPKAATPGSYSPEDFFQTGKTYTNALSISGGTEKNQSLFSAAATNAEGIIPNNKLDRYNFSFRNTSSYFDNKLNLDARAEYIYQKTQNMPGQGQYYNPLTSVYLFPGASENFNNVKNYEVFDPIRKINTQNWAYGDGGINMQNPYWITNRNLFQVQRARVVGSFTAKYNFTDYLNLQGRVRMDRSTDQGETKIYATTLGNLSGNSPNGNYTSLDNLNSQTYADLLLNFNKTFGDFSLNATAGASLQNLTIKGLTIGGPLDPYKVPNFFSLLNVTQANLKPVPNAYREQNQAAFMTATFGYKNYLFLDVTGRNDWNSTLPKPFFYPSVGLSAVVSEMAKLPEFISFAKLRLSYAEVGNAIPQAYAYATNPTYPINGGAIVPFTGKPFSTLKPERSKSFEIGTDLRFMDNKLSLNATYYKTHTVNQFFRVNVSETVGYKTYDLNAGDVQNQGLEMSLGYRAQFGELSWTPNINFSFNRNKIIDLYSYNDPATGQFIDVKQIQLGGSSVIRKGGAYGEIQVKDFQRDANGGLVLDDKGLPQYSNNLITAGNVNPRYMLSMNNGFKYKNFNLNFLVDSRIGGEVISNTERTLDKFGMSQRTADSRNAGGIIANGVDATQQYYGRISSELTPYVYSATNVRLRELSLGYTFPAQVFNNKIQKIQVSVIGRNLWMIYKKAPFDPDVITLTGNAYQGFDDFAMPSLRSIGFNVNFTF
ncbi:SusC/RagA family TonB-linked outer membrane protein [Pedobacter gandavensis]|uniref:SusC/RagA family TonB-linked outer membrane protein n=1 Tax=Pedobacter gandavensis TaxID=2679963 RepID=A0ABR6F045_9SPHI|nr:SusC/RagA family TonB-linked outer membrane protein [Pedobacter gandavensis]MBB2150597.1 SusC/RagA family TonB-linked outer membrane protein [Pedobacter gandavensis]